MYAVGVRVVGLYACITFFVFQVAGQDHVSDTTWLVPLEINGASLDFHSPGGRIESIDSFQLKSQQSSSLGALLQADQGIYLREYGPGMLSSISLRGTAPHHTTLLWNGLPVNFPSLGVADYSLLPAFFIDRAEILYGGSSAVAGSGAIGGAIAVEDVLPKNEKMFAVLQEAGSFSSWMTGLKAQKAGERAGGSLAAFYKRAENDFSFINRSKAGSPRERQQHAMMSGKGLKAALFLKAWENGEFTLNTWLTSSEREIIPPYTVPFNNDVQKDLSLRLALDYTHKLNKKWMATSQIGRIYDQIQFNGLFSATTQYLWSGYLDGVLGSKLQLRMGSLINQLVADVPEYGGKTTEIRTDLYAYINYFPTRNWELSFNNRLGQVAGKTIPYTPTLGSSWLFLNRDNSEFRWRAQLSRSYRMPTLNDRYWNPGGNPRLLPEEALNAESGMEWDYKKEMSSWNASITAYAHWVSNWILWLPNGTIWSPENVRNVLSRGSELTVSNDLRFNSLRFSNRLHYAYTIAEVRKGHRGDESIIGNLLPYTPQHQGSWNLKGEMKQWSAAITGRFYGSRYTLADNDRELPAYSLVDVIAGKSFSFNRSLMSAQFTLRNLFNNSYENLEYRPMPGRSFHLQLNYTHK